MGSVLEMTNKQDEILIPMKCRGIAAILLKKVENGYKVLLLKRDTSILREAWCYIGGSIEKGEKAWEAAIREVREETGITKIILYISNKFDQFYSPNEDYIYVAPVFVGYVGDNQEVVLNYEHKEYQWMTFEEAKNKVTLPGNDEVLEFVEKHFVKRNPSSFLLINQE
jgi:dATP pyrophosphohydrolase